MSTAQRPVFLFGANSMLGWSCLRHGPAAIPFCNRHTRIPAGAGWHPLNLQDRPAVRDLFRRQPPHLIVHCAGICDVDKCQNSPDFAHLVNVCSMEILLDYLPDATRMVYLSSDHVFSGDTGPYTESSPPDPISVYGQTRVAAEELLLAHHRRSLVIRAGLWIGPSYNGRIGHLDWLRYRCARGLPMTVVRDEYRSAVWADDAAQRVWALADSEITGVRHLVASRIVSRPVLAAYLNRRFAINAPVAVCQRGDLDRPHLGVLDLRTEFRDPLAKPLPPVVPW